MLAFSEAAVGLGLAALLIAYLPTIYERVLASRARGRAARDAGWHAAERGRAARAVPRGSRWDDRLPELWAQWEAWFADISETHTSLAVLVFFRSPNPHRSWVTASGAVLDAAALAQSTLAVPWSAQAGLCIRAGYLALREVADFFGIPYDAAPVRGQPISIDRSEFDEVYERLAASRGAR